MKDSKKEKIMKDRIRKMLKQIFLTHIGRLFFVAAPLLIIGGIMSPNGSIGELIYDYGEGGFWHVLFYIGLGIFAIECGLFILYGLLSMIKAIHNWIVHKRVENYENTEDKYHSMIKTDDE